MAPSTFLCAAALAAVAAAGKPVKYQMRDQYFERIRSTGLASLASAAVPADQFFVQTLDHFDVTDSRTWNQRYWVNDTFYKPGGNVFLYVEGEGTGEASDALFLLASHMHKQ
jgi:hypothetical protein